MVHRHHFTLEQAEALRPAVGRIVERMRSAQRRLAAQDADHLGLLAETTGGAWGGRERAHAVVTLSLAFERLEQAEIVVRELEHGIVDFPALVDGREAYLCWQVDEPEIAHWHDLESGFAGRRRLGRAPRPS